jgi:hypothetical protein
LQFHHLPYSVAVPLYNETKQTNFVALSLRANYTD